MAIVHDAFLHVGGAEKVFLELVKIYPDADLYIPIINKNLKKKIENETKGAIYTTFISDWSFFYKQASLLKPFLIFYWEKLNLSKYDLVISSSHSFNSKLVNVSKKSVHISYVYTPPRYLSTQFNEVQILNNPIINFLFSPLLSWLKKKDYESGKKPDLLIGISKEVQNRITNRYKIGSLLIYPPVDLSSKITKNNDGKYYLFFSRLVKQKGAELAVKTCTKLNLPLMVVGEGPELKKLKAIAGPTVTFKGFVEGEKLEKIFTNTKALINCAIEEDFGMVTIEVASRGIPTIGFSSGGLLETIMVQKTGLFFHQHTVESLTEAINKFEQMKFNKLVCHNYAKKFSDERFAKQIKAIINYYVKN